MIGRALTLLLLVFTAAPAALAQSFAVDPNRSVNGSCAEVLRPLFADVQAASLAGDLGRMEVAVTVGEDGVAHPSAGRVSGFTAEGQARVLAAFAHAYEATQREGCVGVITRRTRWIIRKGAAKRLWAPDDPTTINRPVAATTLPDGTRIEMLDPALGFSRLNSPRVEQRGMACYESSPLRDSGLPPPISQMQPGARYNVRFHLERDGRVGAIYLPQGVTADSALGQALERYVRSARYYPQIGADCSTEAGWLTITPERPG